MRGCYDLRASFQDSLSFGKVVISLGFICPEDLSSASEQLNCPSAEPGNSDIDLPPSGGLPPSE